MHSPFSFLLFTIMLYLLPLPPAHDSQVSVHVLRSRPFRSSPHPMSAAGLSALVRHNRRFFSVACTKIIA